MKFVSEVTSAITAVGVGYAAGTFYLYLKEYAERIAAKRMDYGQLKKYKVPIEAVKLLEKANHEIFILSCSGKEIFSQTQQGEPDPVCLQLSKRLREGKQIGVLLRDYRDFTYQTIKEEEEEKEFEAQAIRNAKKIAKKTEGNFLVVKQEKLDSLYGSFSGSFIDSHIMAKQNQPLPDTAQASIYSRTEGSVRHLFPVMERCKAHYMEIYGEAELDKECERTTELFKIYRQQAIKRWNEANPIT